LSQLYEKEGDFSAAYPGNRHVREKIRQQLQVLRDVGIIRFKGTGHYQLVE
jgi:type II restriction enzyme